MLAQDLGPHSLNFFGRSLVDFIFGGKLRNLPLHLTSLEDVPKEVLGKNAHSRNFFGKIFGKV